LSNHLQLDKSLVMHRLLLLSLFAVLFHDLHAQELWSSSKINPQHVSITRDQWGIPHIFGNTDAEAAYGLAWAHAEDDFKHVQENLIAGKGRLAEVQGKEGALFDFGLRFFKIRETIDEKWETDLSDDFKRYLDGYAQGLNAYAAAFPQEVLLKGAFPIHPKDIIAGYTLTLSLMSGVGLTLKAINDNMIDEVFAPNEKGSNAMAIHADRTEDGKTWLLCNSHQPIEGRFAWYEAHLQSNEGLNMLGGLFPGGASIFVGSNEHLGWAHTNNYHNFGDIYELKVHPKADSLYYYDGAFIPFKMRTVRFKVKLAGIKIPIRKKIRDSEYGPVFEKDGRYFALRFPVYQDIRAGEQWYRMNKATQLDDFQEAIKMQALPMFNVIYADKDQNIYFISEGMIPYRDPSLDWSQPIAGVSSAYKWETLVPMEEKPQYLNPECGYVYNANNSPKLATCDAEYRQKEFVGLQQFHYNRGERFYRLLGEQEGKFSWEDFQRIKYDDQYDPAGSYADRFKVLFHLDEDKYPHIADAISVMKRWNLRSNQENEQAALALVVQKELAKQNSLPYAYLMIRKEKISEKHAVEALERAQKFLLKTHGKIELPLGDIQRHIRGQVNLPIDGFSEVNRAVDAKLFDKKKGVYRFTSGDGYIQMVKFDKEGLPEVWAINAYGASARPDSPHYTDQMEMFVRKEMRRMYHRMSDYEPSSLQSPYHPK
jgi:acyl-homoserine-lactone acylase